MPSTAATTTMRTKPVSRDTRGEHGHRRRWTEPAIAPGHPSPARRPARRCSLALRRPVPSVSPGHRRRVTGGRSNLMPEAAAATWRRRPRRSAHGRRRRASLDGEHDRRQRRRTLEVVDRADVLVQRLVAADGADDRGAGPLGIVADRRGGHDHRGRSGGAPRSVSDRQEELGVGHAWRRRPRPRHSDSPRW